MRGRHELLREALEIINLLWRGGYRSYEGKHLRLEDARVFDLPNPANFEAASKTVTADDIRGQFAVGPDAAPYVEAVRNGGGGRSARGRGTSG